MDHGPRQGGGEAALPGAVAVRLAVSPTQEVAMQLVPLDNGKWTMDFGEEIDRGAEWLAEQDASRFDHINLDTLHLASTHACVLGQLAMSTFRAKIAAHASIAAPTWFSGYDAVLSACGKDGLADGWTHACGFNLDIYQAACLLDVKESDLTDPDHPANKHLWEQLTHQWDEKIQKLRADAGTQATA